MRESSTREPSGGGNSVVLHAAMSELAKGCDHFHEYRQNHGLQSFKIIYKYLVKPAQEARKLKVWRMRIYGRYYVLRLGKGTRPTRSDLWSRLQKNSGMFVMWAGRNTGCKFLCDWLPVSPSSLPSLSI